MPDPAFDQISAGTIADIRDDVVVDMFFVEETTQRKLRASGALEEFLGGTLMQEPFIYNRVQGGAIAPGSSITPVQVPIIAATGFLPRLYVETIPLNLWQTNVINNGPAAKVKLTDLYMTVAVQALNTDLGIDFWRHGQASGTGIADNRLVYINGCSEAMNDGVTSSWDGNYFTSYGGQARNGAVGNVLNSIPKWLGDQLGATGQISYKPVIEGYLECVQPPTISPCNKALYAYLLERQEAKQQFTQEKDLSIGLTGIKFMESYIHVDKLCPSTKYGSILPSGLSQTTAIAPSTFTSSAAPNAISNMPAATSLTPGEILFHIRAEDWKIRPAQDEEYNFNFTPPIRSQTEPDLIVMFLKSGINIYCTIPHNNMHMFGAGF